MWWWKYCNYDRLPALRKLAPVELSRASIKGKSYVSWICIRIGNSERTRSFN